MTLILLCFCPVSFVLSCVGIFITPVANHIGASPATLSYYFSILSVAGFVSLPVFGSLFQRVDCRIILSAAVITIAGAFVGQSMVTQVWQFFVCGALAGLGMTPLMYLAPSILVNRWFLKRSGFFIGLVMAFTGIGGVVWNAVGGILIEGIGWQATYVAFAAITLASTLPFTIFVVRDKPEDKGLVPFGAGDSEEPASTESGAGLASKEAYRTASFKLLLVYALLLSMGMYAYSMLPSFIATLPGAASAPMLGAMVSSVAMASQTVGKLVWGAIGERKPVLFIMAGCIAGVSGILVIWLFGSHAALLYVGAVIFGFYYALMNVMNPIVTRAFFGLKDYGVIYSRVTTATTLGMTASSMVWGTLINVFGSYSPMFTGICLMLAMASMVIFAAGRMRPQI